MANVEEMIDGFEWNAIQVDLDGSSIGTKSVSRKRARGAADQIEARLQDELMALEKVWSCNRAENYTDFLMVEE